jgi:Ca2+/Na+ antiporter
MVVIAFIFMTFAESDKGITWKEGISLILLYVFFVVIESYIKTLVT